MPAVITQGVPVRALSTSPVHADIVFREPIPRGKYNLVCVTRCGESLDYKPRRIGHPVRVE